MNPANPVKTGGAAQSGAWLAVLGVGLEGLSSLGETARLLLAQARLVAGGRRHLAMLEDDDPRPRLPWPTPMAEGVRAVLAEHGKGRNVAVLATGNPMFYGAGAMLARHLPPPALRVVPAPSAFALACARLGWAQEEVATLSLHGRPLASLVRYLAPHKRLIALGGEENPPEAIAALLCRHGYGKSTLTVLEAMGGSRERRTEQEARLWRKKPWTPFHCLAICCRLDDEERFFSSVCGLPDEAFLHDGLLTKRFVRAATLARLAPRPGETLWDIGAGCGAVAIEWLRCRPDTKAVAVECNGARVARIRLNAERLGVPELHICEGRAPDVLSGLPPPSAVFVGGGLTEDGVLETCRKALPEGGRLVANAVTLKGQSALMEHRLRLGGTLARFAVSIEDTLGGKDSSHPIHPIRPIRPIFPIFPVALRPALPVLQWAYVRT